MTQTDWVFSGASLGFPGMHKVWAKGGLYIYAWRSGPRVDVIRAGTKKEALAQLRKPDVAMRLAGRLSELRSPRPASDSITALIVEYRKSHAYTSMADSTKDQWNRHLNSIDAVFGSTSVPAIQKKGARALIRKWHTNMADTPRKANYALTVLTRLFNWAVDEERMDKNPAAGLARIDEGPGRQDVTWTEDELNRVCAEAGDRLALAIRLAYLTGMRRGDLLGLTWNDVDFAAGLIRKATSKSNRHIMARIEITPEIEAALKAMPRKAIHVVTNTQNRPYKSAASFSGVFNAAMDRAKVDGKHFHDLRGTRVTLDFAGGMTDSDAERKFGWAPGQGGKMRKVYENPEMVAMARRKRA